MKYDLRGKGSIKECLLHLLGYRALPIYFSLWYVEDCHEAICRHLTILFASFSPLPDIKQSGLFALAANRLGSLGLVYFASFSLSTYHYDLTIQLKFWYVSVQWVGKSN